MQGSSDPSFFIVLSGESSSSIMTLTETLQVRSQDQCELCGSTLELDAYAVYPKPGDTANECAYLCALCREQLDDSGSPDTGHWRCLNDSMWSEVPAVKVLAWRMLRRLQAEDWAHGLADMLYLDEETQAWAESEPDLSAEDANAPHVDTHGAILAAGDTVTLIKDLNVKGANFVAKRGTAVRNIRLVDGHPGQIEGKVNGQQIVILTQYVKKSSNG